jgi:glycosyltransferase involved in cell wall biosynthesis
MNLNRKIRIAFVKFGGLSSGGTERFLQNVAVNLPSNLFEVSYFYCDSCPYLGSDYKHPNTDFSRLSFMQNSSVKLIKFHAGLKDIRSPEHKWIDTDFWDHFSQDDYDIIQTGRAGHSEYPFNQIKNTPIVDSLHLSAGVDNQYNISRVMHLCKWNADSWISQGGDSKRVVYVSHLIDSPNPLQKSLRNNLSLESSFVFGFHQRDDNSIFSPMPLSAYSKIESKNTAFVMRGGGDFYKKQAIDLKLKNVHFLPHTGDSNQISKFLKTLDIYSHGRFDGEINSVAMAEAMSFGLPIISHKSHINNGHIECIGDAGKVVENESDYVFEMKRLMTDETYRTLKSKLAKERFLDNYEINGQINRIIEIYNNVIKDPFQGRRKRFLELISDYCYFKK